MITTEDYGELIWLMCKNGFKLESFDEETGEQQLVIPFPMSNLIVHMKWDAKTNWDWLLKVWQGDRVLFEVDPQTYEVKDTNPDREEFRQLFLKALELYDYGDMNHPQDYDLPTP